MVPSLYFLLFFLVLAGVAYGLTVRGMGGPLLAAGPSRVGGAIRTRNRSVLLFTVVVLVVTAVLEALLPAVSEGVLGLQYAFGDLVDADPALVYETANGTVSWGLYLAVLLGVLGGLAAGTMAAVRRYPILRGLGVRDVM